MVNMAMNTRRRGILYISAVFCTPACRCCTSCSSSLHSMRCPHTCYTWYTASTHVAVLQPSTCPRPLFFLTRLSHAAGQHQSRIISHGCPELLGLWVLALPPPVSSGWVGGLVNMLLGWMPPCVPCPWVCAEITCKPHYDNIHAERRSW